ncbi:cytochrome P450 [Flammula alnicola]|nr:cytochrome P450 [Flammula alnicola]
MYAFESILPGFQQVVVHNPLLLIGITSVLYWFLLSHYTGQTRKYHQLKHIPTVGSEEPFLSYFGALTFIIDARKLVDTGMKKWPKRMFKVPQMSEWMVIASQPKAIEELRKAPENVLSSMIAIDETLQVEYTLGENISKNPYHIPIIRAQLTRALPKLVPEVHEEIEDAFKEFIPATDDWTSVKMLDTAMKIVGRASNRIFVGTPLCRDPDYIKLNVQFTIDVVQAGAILRAVPRLLRPLVNSLISNVPKRIRHGLKHLGPVIQARRQEREEKGDQADKPVDLLTWLMDEAKGEEATDWYLTSRILTVNFAAIHTSSMTFTHAFYYLAAYPEYLQALREEVEEVVKDEGWTKAGLDKMHKIDSFIKESQRLHPLGNIMMQRVAVKDFTFSDGTIVPRGTTVGVAVQRAHMTESVYEDPMKFDGFRFVKMKEREGMEKKFDMVSTSCESLAFGHGRHACPGRYFATCELKLMLAHTVVTYDVKLETEGVRPADMWVATACVPNPKANVLFRRRVVH